jgi:hypothetical protein
MSIKITRPGKTQKVALGKMVVSDTAQRELKEYRVSALLREFDIELLGLPVLNYRDGVYYIVDGQHRIAALKEWLGEGWEPQVIDCQVHDGLTEAQEARLFIDLNNKLTVSAFDKFKTAVTAGLPVETSVKRIVESEGLAIAKTHKTENTIGAVTVLTKVYRRSGGDTLARTLRIIRDAYPAAPFEGVVIDGIGHLCERYNGALDDSMAVNKLGSVRGGMTALLARAETLHKQTRQNRAHCVAAAAVDILNSKRGGKKIPSWWST